MFKWAIREKKDKVINDNTNNNKGDDVGDDTDYFDGDIMDSY